ncbi:tape measure protein [Sphingobium phenoxybenzoativorans]|uniref:Tape measure protein n=1 Tax=Sphingobium phenoxybenzoativorans TaxID=1592790 RepID=A0A975KAP6_9SPHN|nr:tape measure protein [Sphingobium phenoxybenzoativorans]QUT07911.1 tape measure protein [Sphingobium phenoxybenzoativorans]
MAKAVIGALRVTLGLDSAEFTKGINNASRQAKGFEAASKTMANAAQATTNAIRGLGAAFGIVSIGAAGKAFLDLATQSKQMTAQLKLATAEFGRLSEAQNDVRRISAITRSGLGETTKLYGNFVRAVKDLGGTQEDASRATLTFSQALKLGGASQVEAASATLQFGQALASGVLRGDEFNSVMEASPRLSKLLAESLNVPVGALRKMAEEGELTADKLVNALTNQKFTAGIDAEFKELPVTFDEAMGQVRNAAVITFGAFDQGGQFSTAFANFIIGGADGLSDLELAAEQAGVEMRATFEGLRNVFEPMVQGALSAFGTIDQRANYTRDGIANLFGAIDDLNNFLPNLNNRANAFDRRFFGTTFLDEAPTSNLRGNFLKGYNSAQSKFGGAAAEARFRTMNSGYDILGNRVNAVGKKVTIPGKAEKPKKAKKGPKEKTPIDYTAENIYDFKVALNDALDQPLDFTAINKSVDLGLDQLAAKFKKTAEDGSQSMANLVNNSLNALNNFAASIKSGGFLDILSSAFNAFGSLAKTGIFGSKLATGFKDFTAITGYAGARAAGGPVTGGRTYLVGERGPELFTATRSGYIHPNGANDNGAGARPYFDLRGAVMTADLLAQMNQVGEVSAIRGASGGTAGAVRAQQRSSKWQIP